MSLLVPRLDRESARTILASVDGRSPDSIDQPIEEEAVTFAPVGGTRIRRDQLDELRREVRLAAVEHGYPGRIERVGEWDARVAGLLHANLPMTCNEASEEGVWSYLTCCWLLDVARWRFGSEADERRFIGNVNRNTFRRLWWRTEILGPEVELARLGEDELVNVMERPTIAADRRLARAVVAEFLARADSDAIDRMRLMREAMKRLLRLTPFVAFPSLSDDQLRDLSAGIFDAAEAGLAGKSVPVPVIDAGATPSPSTSLTVVDAPTVGDGSANGAPEDLELARESAVEIARRTGRVTNQALRDLLEVDAVQARRLLQALTDDGRLIRRGNRRGTHYVLPDAPTDPAPATGDAPQATEHESELTGSPLRRLLRRGEDER